MIEILTAAIFQYWYLDAETFNFFFFNGTSLFLAVCLASCWSKVSGIQRWVGGGSRRVIFLQEMESLSYWVCSPSRSGGIMWLTPWLKI